MSSPGLPPLLKHTRAWHVGLGKLVDQARLAHAGLAHNGHDLAMPSSGLLQGLPERFKLVLPTHKARQTTRGHSLEAAMDRTGPDELEHLHWLRQALHRELAQRPHLDQSIDEVEGGRRQSDTAR